MLAYVVAALEQYTLDQLRVAGADDAELERARQQIDRAMQSVWSNFYHRNISPEVYEYFASTFPIAEAGKAQLARRCISPLLLNDEG